MKIIYISDNKIYKCTDGKITELSSERAQHYKSTVSEIRRNKEWKHSGTGAQFMGTAAPSGNESIFVSINGIADDGTGLVYSIQLGEMGGIYRKNPDKPEAAEEHIFTGMNRDIGSISIKNGKIAACSNGHLSIFDMKGNFEDITDGDSIESQPCWSADDDRIFCSTAGIARNQYGAPAAYSPRSIMAVDLNAGSMEELFADEKYDFLRPSNDSSGNFYCIRQPYKVAEEKNPLWKDVLLFPVRIIKALLGFLNAFSVLFGGESLRSGRKQGDVKTKEKSDRELFFEGRLLEAEKNEKENTAKGEKNPGIFPLSRVLVRIAPDGTETVLKRGVMDYAVLPDGSIICSNGRSLLHITDSGEELIAKAKMAQNICVLGD
ncbi:MAG: hypothetical protein PUB66_04390 [Oscillospiraceae bacterium]|nr:hypothetical protein [Oscillospiraceae bacterium]